MRTASLSQVPTWCRQNVQYLVELEQDRGVQPRSFEPKVSAWPLGMKPQDSPQPDGGHGAEQPWFGSAARDLGPD